MHFLSIYRRQNYECWKVAVAYYDDMALVVHLMLCTLHNSMYLSNSMVLDIVHIMLKLKFNQLHSVRQVTGIVKINTIFSSLCFIQFSNEIKQHNRNQTIFMNLQ